MADLIDRAALIKEIWSIGNHPWSDWETAGVINLVNRQTAVDAVEVGNCKGCIWSNRKRPQKCSCCRRNPDMKDCYEVDNG